MLRDISTILKGGNIGGVCIVYCQRAKLGCVLEKGSKGYNLALL